MKKISTYTVIISAVIVLMLSGNSMLSLQTEKSHQEIISTIVGLFPAKAQDIKERTQRVIQSTQQRVQAIIAIENSQRTYENTAQELDTTVYLFSCEFNPINVLEMVSPIKEIRDASHEASIELQQCAIDVLGANKELYQAFKYYAEHKAPHEQLNDEQRRYIDETMKDFKRLGLGLADKQLERVKELNKKLVELSLQFEANIAQDNRTIEVTRDELKGLDDDFINALQRTESGNYLLGTDYPTYFKTIENCLVESTREKLYVLFNQRAYPVNVSVLNDIIGVRHELAQLLEFESYAAFDIDNQMAQTVTRVRTFIKDITSKAQIKAHQEVDNLIKNLPAHITLTKDGKIKPWDMYHITSAYKKNHYSLSEDAIAEYFPTQKTVKGLMGIFEQFMNIQLNEIPVVGLWSDDLTLLEVKDNNGARVRGYIILDLFPRPNKYSHAASTVIIETLKNKQGDITPAIDLVLCNFPKATAYKPSLLTHKDVTTFFHEFGHAIHTVLGSAQMSAFSGTKVKRDFVELPSQMLEEWMWDKEMLKKVSSHYITGNPLPDDILDTKIKLKNFDTGHWALRQMFLASISLEFYLGARTQNLDAVVKRLSTSMATYLGWDDRSHIQTSFGHLTGYGAGYYGYMWSKVFALDLFATIKNAGLLNSEIGQRYVNTILAPGGSADPNDMLANFLGRDPNSQAFFEDLGI